MVQDESGRTPGIEGNNMSSDFKYNRRSCRLQEWDYRTPGSYFITIKTGDGTHYFNNPKLKAIAEKYWKTIPRRHRHVELGAYEIMPDHIHGIITIVRYPDPDGKKQIPARHHTTPHRGIMLHDDEQMLHNAPTGVVLRGWCGKFSCTTNPGCLFPVVR